MKAKYKLNKYISFIFYILLILLTIGLSSLYYYSSKNSSEKFENKIVKDSLYIREQFRVLLDRTQYDFRQKEQENIKKLNFAVDYIEKNENYSISELNNLLNDGVTFGKYEIFIINKNYTIEKTSFAPDLGMDFSRFKVVKDLFDSVFTKKINMDISSIKIDTATMGFKRYLIKLSKDSEKIVQIGFALNPREQIKEKHKSLSYLANEIKLSIVSKNAVQDINLDNTSSFKKKSMKENWSTAISFLNELIIQFPEYQESLQKIVNTDMNKKRLILSHELSKIFKNENKLLVKFDNTKEYTNIYSITNGVFNDKNDKTKLIVKTTFKNDILNQEINRTLYTSIGIFVLLFSILFFMYIFILNNVTSKLLSIISNIKRNDKSNEKEIIIEEINSLQDDYNELHEKLNNTIQKNQLLLSQNKQFIADMVHQIRTPLSVIMTNTNLIELTSKNQDKKEFLDSINSSINMLTNSYEDLSYVVVNDTIEYVPHLLSLSNILKDRCGFFTSIAQSKKIMITDKIESNVEFLVNEVEIERLIDNNLSNAIKYSNINTDIEVLLKKLDGNKILLSFSSIGDKIENIDKIFERYFRENSSEKGSGIGLNIVKNICEKYSIETKIESINGRNIFTYNFKI